MFNGQVHAGFALEEIQPVLLAILLFFGLLYWGRSFLIPIAIGMLIAMLLLPVSRWLERRKISRGLAAFLCVLAVMVLFLSV